jgi:hypothetical protein
MPHFKQIRLTFLLFFCSVPKAMRQHDSGTPNGGRRRRALH